MIREKYIKILLFTILSFTFCSKVEAGVCKGYELDSNGFGTCRSLRASIWTPDFLKSTYGSYFLRPGYVASTTVGDAMAFCLDPGLPRPTQELSYVREIDNSDTDGSGCIGSIGYDITNPKISEISKDCIRKVYYYDDGIYRMYQHFYNNLIWSLNNGGLSDNGVNQQRSYFQNALRVWTYRNGFDYLSEESAKYQIDAPHFKTCANYIDGNVAKGTYQTLEQCYGNSSYKAKIQEYYNSMGKNYLWVNPLKINTKSTVISGQDGKNYYRYEFNIVFNDGVTKFFDDTYSQGIYYRDINIGNAEFYLNGFNVNGTECSTNEICYNYSGGGIVNTGDSRQFIVELSEEQYNSFKSNSSDGSVNVTMNYGYQHPMNIENLYTARYDFANSYQRMLVIRNYIHEDSVSIGKAPEVSKCAHTSSGFTNSQGRRISNLSDFIASCGCNSVNRDLLTGGDLDSYNNKCSNFISEESYKGSINNCDDSQNYDEANSDTNFSNYSLGYKKVSKINNYCTETCNEDIVINDLKGKYTTVAGTYFEFKKYPNLIATKKCNVDIDYSTWSNDYNNNLKELVDKYNVWQEAKAAQLSEDSSKTCNKTCCGGYDQGICKRWCYDTLYTYNYSYQKAVIVNYTNLNLETGSGYKTSCGSRINWGVATKLSDFQALSSKATSISNLKSDLKTCNSRLFASSDKDFYDFKQQLNYYYYQTYSDKSVGTRGNNERTSFGGINDSEFNVSSNMTSTKSGSGANKSYASLTEGGINKEEIFTYNNSVNISRTVEYKVTYNRPRFEKFADVFTGKINTVGTENKSISLGYVYDTDASAIPKANNQTYYSFTKLGASDNKLFNHFKNGKEIKRTCTYKITNDIIGCEDDSCDNKDTKLKVVFRIVDPNNLDPNGRFGTDEGFKNWNNDKGKTVKSKIESDDTYNPENLEYSFTLNSATMKAIREYNSGCVGNECNPISYSNTSSFSELECEEGNKCKSKFIDEALKSTNNFGKQFVFNTNGRDRWNVYSENESNGKHYIDGEEVKIK